ncbi:MAG: hypothetical protein JW708_09470 [Vallitaleaceae bacterium]|nr:hypothetical protein [Vallitaleaceae bacterium]
MNRKEMVVSLLLVLIIIIVIIYQGDAIQKEVSQNEVLQEEIQLEDIPLYLDVNTEFISKIECLEEYISEICNLSLDQPDDIEKLNTILFSILIRNRYGINNKQLSSILWNSIIGEMDSKVAKILEDSEKSREQSTRHKEFFEFVEELDVYFEKDLLIHKENLDFLHMVAVVNTNYKDIEIDDSTEKYVDILTGWGGDLLTYLGEILLLVDKQKMTSLVEIEKLIFDGLANKSSQQFGSSDFIADIDGVNLASYMKKEHMLFSTALETYYIESVNERYQLFLNEVGGMEEFEYLVTTLFNHLDQIKTDTLKENSVIGLRSYMKILSLIHLHRKPYDYEVQALINSWIKLWRELS